MKTKIFKEDIDISEINSISVEPVFKDNEWTIYSPRDEWQAEELSQGTVWFDTFNLFDHDMSNPNTGRDYVFVDSKNNYKYYFNAKNPTGTYQKNKIYDANCDSIEIEDFLVNYLNEKCRKWFSRKWPRLSKTAEYIIKGRDIAKKINYTLRIPSQVAYVNSLIAPCTGVELSEINKEVACEIKTLIVEKEFNGYIGIGGNFSKLENLIIEEGIETIKDVSFYCLGTDGIKLTLPKSLKVIGDRAFECTGIKGDVILPDGLERIGKEAFWGNKITSIFIPKSVKFIGTSALAVTSKMYSDRVDLYFEADTPPTEDFAYHYDAESRQIYVVHTGCKRPQ